MKRKSTLLLQKAGLCSLLLLCLHVAFAQTTAISGKVTNARTHEGMPGVSVQVKGTTLGVATDNQGNFSLQAPSPSSILIFSSSGFGTQEIPLSNQTTLNVELSATAVSLDEVVVIGYGTIRKRDLTGSVGLVKAQALAERPQASLNEELAG